MSLSARATLSILGLAALVGCASFGKTTPPASCPSLRLLGDASDITRYDGAGRDVTDLVLDGRITAVPAQCSYGDNGSVLADLTVQASISRGPAATTRQASVAYVVTVMDGDTIVDQQDVPANANFPSNVDTVASISDPLRLRLPSTPQKSAAAYKIYIGFRLTPAELAINRARGPR